MTTELHAPLWKMWDDAHARTLLNHKRELGQKRTGVSHEGEIGPRVARMGTRVLLFIPTLTFLLPLLLLLLSHVAMWLPDVL